MNQDFALCATPANARRLLTLQRSCPIDLPPQITELAQQDALSAEQFGPLDYDPIRHTVAQFLLDCRLRGIVQTNYHPQFDQHALLHTIKLAEARQIVIVTASHGRWADAITATSLGKVTHVHQGLSYEHIEQYRRDSVLVVDVGARPEITLSKLRQYAREFAQTIIFDGCYGQTTHWSIWAHALFPTMPHPLYARLAVDTPPQWHSLPLVSFAPFYNACIFPHLITDTHTIEHMLDRNVKQQLRFERSKLLS